VSNKYDVIVVGAGPSGFLAAKAAGENGLEVALLERKSDLTQLSRACGQCLSSANEYFFGNLFRYNARDKRICFSSDGFSFKYDGPCQNVYNLMIYTPNGHKIEFGDHKEQKEKGDYGRVAITFDKEALFRSMLEEVKACSVKVFPGINVERVTSNAEGVKVEGSGKSFEGAYLIAADGVNSRIARVMGFNEDRTYYCNFYAVSYYMSGLEFPGHDQIVKTSAILKEGAFTCYIVPRPTEGEYNLMVLTVDPRADLKVGADYFMEGAFCAPWFKKAKTLKTLSAVCNCYSPIVKPYRDRVLIAGDAGSTQEMELTGAIVSGWKAGQAVTTALQEANLELEVTGISQYTDWWENSYINCYSHEEYMKGSALPYLLTTEEEVNYVFGLIKGTLPACFNAYSGPTKQAMREAMPIIQRERPEVFQKLQRKSLPASEIFAELTKISKPIS